MKKHLKMYLRVLSRPVYTFGDIKETKSFSLKYSFILFLFFILAQVLKRQLTGFTFNSNNLHKFNILTLFIEAFAVLLLWTVANWAVSTLCFGEGRLKQVWVFSLVATIPYSISLVLYTFLSNILTPDEAIFLQMVSFIGIFWTAILLFVGLMILHDFSLFRVLWTSLLTVALMAVVLFLLILVYSLFKQITGFGTDIFEEIAHRF